MVQHCKLHYKVQLQPQLRYSCSSNRSTKNKMSKVSSTLEKVLFPPSLPYNKQQWNEIFRNQCRNVLLNHIQN